MLFDQVIVENITIVVRGREGVSYYAARDEEPYSSTGDRIRNDWVPFKDYMTGGSRAVSDMPGDAIIPWSLGKRCALEFARNGGRFTGVDWEEL
mgnify:CR=1 FL=1